MTPTTNTPVIGLVRVSTDEQEASGAGLDAQESLIRARCEQRGWHLTEIVRESASGKTLAKRPELQAILARLEDTSDAERPRALVVAKMDRLARSLLDYASMLERAEKNGWTLVCIEPDIDFSTPAGRMFGGQLMNFAQYEREINGERTRAALAEKRRQGVILGRPRANDPRAREKRPEQAERMEAALRLISTLRAEGLSHERIAARLNDQGIRGPQGGGWFKQSVAQACRRYGISGKAVRA